MKSLSTEQKIYYTLRIAAAMCFIGHGAFGIITKSIWCNYFAVFGIGTDMAYQLMPALGVADIILGLILLVYPLPAVALWLVIWSFVTASLRPLSGELIAELFERAGNFGAPLALLLLCDNGKSLRSWFQKMNIPSSLPDKRLKKIQVTLRIGAFLLLASHSWLNLTGKKGLLGQYNALGFHDAHQVAFIAGLFELAAALLILVRPSRPLILLLVVWKMSTELFYPHYELFEWVERGGSYGVLLSLWFSMLPANFHRKLIPHLQ